MSIISEIDFIEIPFEAIGKSGTIRTGAGFHSNDFTTSGVPLIKIGNIKGNEIDLSRCDFISESEKKINLTKEKDVLVAMRGATSGKLGIVTSNSANCFYVGSIGNLGPLNEELIYEPYLKWLEFQLLEILKTKSKGSAQPMVSIAMLKEFVLRIPKTKKQQKFFCELMESRLEQVEIVTTEIDQQQTYLQLLRQTILQEAVQGKLSRQDPTDEPATELIKRIKTEKEKLIGAGKLKKEKELPPIKEGEILFELPDGWVWCRLGEVIELISGQHVEAADWNDRKDGYPYLTGPSDFGEVNPIFARWTNKPKIFAMKDDVLITVKGSGVGKLNLLHEDKVAIGRQLMAIRVKYLERGFVFLFLKSNFHVFQNEKSGIAIPGIAREDILEKVFPLPPLAEQQRIVAKVEQCQQQLNELELQVQQSRKYGQQLLQSVLKEAFGLVDISQFPLEVEIKKAQPESYLSGMNEYLNFSSMKIVEILQEVNTPVQANTVWKQSEYKDDIEEFYAQLKKLVDEEKSVVEEKVGKHSYLKLASLEN